MHAFEAAQRRAMTVLAERAPGVAAALDRAGGGLAASAAAVLAISEFVLDALCRDPALWEAAFAASSPQLETELLPLPQLPSAEAATSLSEEARFMAALRRWRRVEFARIAWRDLAQWAGLDETLASLSLAAERALRVAERLATQALVQRYGEPRGESGAVQRLIVVAMGKLGGGELNFSSDIDLVPVYAEAGETDGARSISNQEFFTRVVQQMIRLLGQQTEEGFVFRIDLRLRPFGDSGPVVANAAALEDYLQIHGRDWERYAWVKARAITNERSYQELFANLIRPFVYRRYLDFGVFESLREMKALIEREVQRRELEEDIKLGDGGIREIEFIVQSFQLIRGGQERRLQESSLRRALPLLAGAKLLPAAAVAELDAAYVFLRRLENRLQMHADQQLHRLPADPAGRERLAWSMGLTAWNALAEQLAAHRGRVSAHFRAVVFGSEDAGAAVLPPLPLDADSAEPLSERLAVLGWDSRSAAVAARLLREFNQGAATRRLDKAGSRRLAALLPVLAVEIADARTAANAAASAARARSHRRALGVPRAAAAQLACARAPGAARDPRRFPDRPDCLAPAAAR
jgi:[glutamine synthetase] adenylyltransferase / [glutamine synthetase]-adenylyl-L-tyrosine phosphorylase